MLHLGFLSLCTMDRRLDEEVGVFKELELRSASPSYIRLSGAVMSGRHQVTKPSERDACKVHVAKCILLIFWAFWGYDEFRHQDKKASLDELHDFIDLRFGIMDNKTWCLGEQRESGGLTLRRSVPKLPPLSPPSLHRTAAAPPQKATGSHKHAKLWVKLC